MKIEPTDDGREIDNIFFDLSFEDLMTGGGIYSHMLDCFLDEMNAKSSGTEITKIFESINQRDANDNACIKAIAIYLSLLLEKVWSDKSCGEKINKFLFEKLNGTNTSFILEALKTLYANLKDDFKPDHVFVQNYQNFIAILDQKLSGSYQYRVQFSIIQAQRPSALTRTFSQSLQQTAVNSVLQCFCKNYSKKHSIAN